MFGSRLKEDKSFACHRMWVFFAQVR